MSQSLVLLFLFALPAPARQGELSTTPPSTVLVRGGSTIVGSTPEEILALLKRSPDYHSMVRALDAETPQHEEEVADFHLMVNEVTNEQYQAFVQTTGFRPPLLWASEQALVDARTEHARLEAEAVELAKKENRTPPEHVAFDETLWWASSWNEHPWAMPEELALVPVVYVDHDEVLAFCRWAGMRLPSEVEFQRAVRGNTKRPYPWGEDWPADERSGREAKQARPVLAATSETSSAPTKVGSFPAGASKDGVFDLIGNTWEWTSSAYMPLPGFDENEYRVARDTVLKSAALWDPDRRVAVGGSYGQRHDLGRATVRRGTSRAERALGLGFRCAASPRAAVDIADAILRSEVMGSDQVPEGITYATAATIGMDVWSVAPSASAGAPPGYQVIRGYRYVLFAPVTKLGESQEEPFHRASLETPVHLGYLATSEPIQEPALAPGTYLVAFRAAGHPTREERTPAHVREALAVAGTDLERANFLFLDPRDGAIVGALPVERCEFGKPGPPGRLDVAERLILDTEIESALRARVLHITMSFGVPPELASTGWRRGTTE